MKKTALSLLLALLLGIFLSTGASGAERGKMTLNGNMTSIKHGDTVTLTVELNKNPGVKTLRCTVGFDPQVLEFVKAEKTKTLPNFSLEGKSDGVLLRWGSDKDLTATGELARVTLRVKEDAIFGDSAVTLNVSENLYDAQNEAGDSVPFDTTDLKFVLLCPHKETTPSIEQEATFETEGILKRTCTACENVTTSPLSPTVNSCDGRVGADVSVGEFSNSDAVEIYLEDLYDTEEARGARELLGENTFYTFRIRFTKNGENYIPARNCKVRLSSDFPLPEGTVLYALADGGSVQTKFEIEEKDVFFDYDDVIFALVNRPYEEPVIPTATTTTTTTTPPASTVSSLEAERKKDLWLIGLGCGALVVCGVGMILLLGRRKRY